jgi:hypothetical protein
MTSDRLAPCFRFGPGAIGFPARRPCRRAGVVWADSQVLLALAALPERRYLWEIFEDRYRPRFLIMTPELAVGRGDERIGDPVPSSAGADLIKSLGRHNPKNLLASFSCRRSAR